MIHSYSGLEYIHTRSRLNTMPKVIDEAQLFRDVMQMVIQHGYAGATTKMLAKAAGIGEVTLFRKYGNKAQLVQKAMVSLAEEYDFEGSVRYTGDLQADLLRVVEAYQTSSAQDGRFFYTILIESERHPDLAVALDSLRGRLGVVGQLLMRYQMEGSLKPMHPVHMLATLIGPIIALNMLSTAMKGMPIPTLDLTQHIENFIDGYRP